MDHPISCMSLRAGYGSAMARHNKRLQLCCARFFDGSNPVNSQASPFICDDQKIRDEWIDYNGHFNMGYYGVLFDIAGDDAFDAMELGEAYVKTGYSFYTLEAHITYLRELHAGDTVTTHYRVLDYDTKRIHYFEEMYHKAEGWLAATMEAICMHIDTRVTKSAPFPDHILANVAAMHARHNLLPRPPQVGHVIGIKRKAPGN
jgi:acyl-CoA thioester hydrolase